MKNYITILDVRLHSLLYWEGVSTIRAKNIGFLCGAWMKIVII